jgi:hypothetical protein
MGQQLEIQSWKKRRGVRRKGNKLEAYVRVRGVLYTARFPLDTPVKTIGAWRKQIKREYGLQAPLSIEAHLEAQVAAWTAALAAYRAEREA